MTHGEIKNRIDDLCNERCTCDKRNYLDSHCPYHERIAKTTWLWITGQMDYDGDMKDHYDYVRSLEEEDEINRAREKSEYYNFRM